MGKLERQHEKAVLASMTRLELEAEVERLRRQLLDRTVTTADVKNPGRLWEKQVRIFREMTGCGMMEAKQMLQKAMKRGEDLVVRYKRCPRCGERVRY